MHTRLSQIAVVLVGFLASGCGEFLEFNAEAPKACVTVTGIHVVGIDESPVKLPTPSGVQATVRHRFEVPLDSTGLPTGSSARVWLVSFDLAAQGAGDFAFVESAQLAAIATTGTKPLGTYSRTVAAPKVLTMQPEPPPEVTGYIANGKLQLEGSLTGTTPAKGFDSEATVCFAVTTTLAMVE